MPYIKTDPIAAKLLKLTNERDACRSVLQRVENILTSPFGDCQYRLDSLKGLLGEIEEALLGDLR